MTDLLRVAQWVRSSDIIHVAVAATAALQCVLQRYICSVVRLKSLRILSTVASSQTSTEFRHKEVTRQKHSLFLFCTPYFCNCHLTSRLPGFVLTSQHTHTQTAFPGSFSLFTRVSMKSLKKITQPPTVRNISSCVFFYFNMPQSW